MRVYIGLFLLHILVIPISAQFAKVQYISPSIGHDPNDQKHVKTADINGDGFDDIVCKSYDGGRLCWIANEEGMANFQELKTIDPIGNVAQIKPVDLDQDGDIDVVCSYYISKKLFWYENLDGMGHFSGANFIATSAQDVNFIETGDLNGDGHLDIVTIHGWYKSQGNGSFDVIKVYVANPQYKAQVYPSDVDGDGDLDLMVGHSSASTEVVWFENPDGNGNFGSFQVLINEPAVFYRSVVIADLDSDGDDEIICAGISKLFWYKSNGDGTYGSQQVLTSNDYGEVHSVTVGDLENDGDLDIVATYASKKTYWFKNINGAGLFTAPLLIANGEIEYDAHTIVDMDNDGRNDLLSTSFYGTSTVWLRHLSVVGTFERERLISKEIEGLDPLFKIVDVDSDGSLDLLSSGNSNYNFANEIVWQSNLDGEHHFSNLNTVSNTAKMLDCGDVEGDGDVDILARDTFLTQSGIKYFLFQNTGQGNFITSDIFFTATSMRFQRLVDIDGDNDLDVFFYDSNTSAKQFKVCINDGLGNFNPAVVLFTFSAQTPSVVFVEDINADGFKDIVVGYGAPAKLVCFENMGSQNIFGTEQPMLDFDEFFNSLTFKFVDFDNDNDLDLLTMYTFDKEIYLNINSSGQGTWGAPILLLTAPYVIDHFYPVDMDDDGDKDIITFPSGFGANMHLYAQDSLGNLTIDDEFTTSIIGDYLDLEDVDRDGDIDIMALSSDNHRFYENYLNNPKIKGNVYWDLNENGEKDSTEVGLYLQKVTLMPTELINLSAEGGKYEFAVDPGQYQLEVKAAPGWAHTGDSIVSFNLLTNGTIQENNFGLKAIDPRFGVNINASSGPTRCGFQVPVWLHYSNQGATYMNGLIHLKMDSLVNFLSAIPAPDSISGKHYYWEIADIAPTHSGVISITTQMPGVNNLGDTITFFSDIFAIEPTSSVSLVDSTTYTSIINCAYDPNDKLVEPNFPGYPNFTLFGDTLEYTIRFQNTGTDTAFTVRLEDYLDEKLDLSTFHVLASSHPFAATLNDSGKLTFVFDNILLTPKSQSEIKSQGFVKYAIAPKDSLSENTPISNNAGIYFDYNPPIFTNKVTNILVSKYPVYTTIQPPSCYNFADGSIEIDFPFFPVSYTWGDGSTQNKLEAILAGSYALTMTDNDGFVILDTIIILENESDSIYIVQESTSETNNLMNGTATAIVSGGIPPYTYLWNTIPSQSSATASNLASGTYSVTVLDANNCSQIVSIDVSRTSSTANTYIKSAFEIRPNPAHDFVRVKVELPTSKLWNLEINDINGKLIGTYKPDNLSQEMVINTANLPSGIYNVSLITEDTVAVKSLVVIK